MTQSNALPAEDYDLESPSNLQRSTQTILADYVRHPHCKRLISRIVAEKKARDIKSLAILSCFPGEGKTVCVAALAVGLMTFLDMRILILDSVSQTRVESFYYRGSIENSSNVFGRSLSNRGKIELITTRSLNHNMQHRQSYAAGTSLLPESLAIQEQHHHYDSVDFRIGAFLESVKNDYDLVLLDTCAITTANKQNFDPILLAQHADASIVVTSSASLDRTVLRNLMQELKQNRISPLGFILDAGVH